MRFNSSVDCFPKLVSELEEETVKKDQSSPKERGKKQGSLFSLVSIRLADERVEEDLKIWHRSERSSVGLESRTI